LAYRKTEFNSFMKKRLRICRHAVLAAIRPPRNGSLSAVHCRSSPCPVCRLPDQLVCADEPQATKGKLWISIFITFSLIQIVMCRNREMAVKTIVTTPCRHFSVFCFPWSVLWLHSLRSWLN
jgi:hypothetical protein